MGVLHWRGCFGKGCGGNEVDKIESSPTWQPPEYSTTSELGGLQNDEPTASIMPVDENFSETEPATVDQGEFDSRESSSAAGCGCKKNFLQSFVLLVGSLLIFTLKE